MTGPEQGFLLLTSQLGDPECKVLTAAQLRVLSQRVRAMEPPAQMRELTEQDLVAIGYDHAAAQRIIGLLSRRERLLRYLRQGEQLDCYPVTRINAQYPGALHKVLGADCPGVLWAKGDLSILDGPAIALVGSRDLQPENSAFATEAGKQAALQGYTLVSGNARGADRTAQESCLHHGGKVISVVADSLQEHAMQKNVLYLSESGFDMAFSAKRALSRNRVIHALGRVVLVAQCGYGKGGTWSGTVQNLRHDWTPVFCFRDGSASVQELVQMGAQAIGPERLHDLSKLMPTALKFL